MKKKLKKWVTLCLAFAMVLGTIAPGKVQAAVQTKSMTLYKGEAIYLTNYYKVKSVSSSKKSVVSVSKDKSNNTHANVTAKKTGTATVTIKTSKGTYKYKITVKKLDIKATLKNLENGNILLTVKNNTKQTFTGIDLQYTLRDADGVINVKDKTTVTSVVAGKTVYKQISYDNSAFTPDLSQCTVKATADSRSLNAKYTNASSKVSTSVTEEKDLRNGQTIEFTVKKENTLKDQSVSGDVYILVYDENGKLVNTTSTFFYLKGGAVDTSTCTCFFYSGTDVSNYTFKFSTVAYYTTY